METVRDPYSKTTETYTSQKGGSGVVTPRYYGVFPCDERGISADHT